MTVTSPARIRCRAIREADAPALAALLTRGFRERSVHYWARALGTLAEREAPEGFPRFGYLLENDATPVGAILMIFRRVDDQTIRCNISSWYVEDAFRGYASLLIAAALRHKDVTYVNISPARHTWPVIEAQGFRRYANGQMLTMPILSQCAEAVAIEPFDALAHADALSTQEQRIMTDHVARGCIGLVARSKEATHPFLFLPRRILSNRAPALQLVYCRELADYIRFAGPIGRKLLRRGHALVLVDALERLPALRGFFLRDRGPKYARGPLPPRLGDLSFCENILFGP
jgi:hypothetical protein